METVLLRLGRLKVSGETKVEPLIRFVQIISCNLEEKLRQIVKKLVYFQNNLDTGGNSFAKTG